MVVVASLPFVVGFALWLTSKRISSGKLGDVPPRWEEAAPMVRRVAWVLIVVGLVAIFAAAFVAEG